MRRLRPTLRWPALLCAALALAACAELLVPRSAPLRHYVLNAVSEPEPEPSSWSPLRRRPTIGIANVNLADYLDRGEIVTRDGRNQLTLGTFDQWAAPLDRHISIVLSENLTRLVPSDRVLLLPASRAVPLDYRVEATIVRFDGDAGGEVVLIARWGVFDGQEHEELAFGRSTFRRRVAIPPATDGASHGAAVGRLSPAAYDAIVVAMSELLGDLSREIAIAVRGLEERSSLPAPGS